MKNRSYLISFFAWLAFIPAWLAAQKLPDSLRLERSLPVVARFATTDNLGNLYVITPNNAVEKYSPENQLLSRYSNNRLGAASWLDVSNPLKILIWYADFRTLAFLDRNLTQLGELNLIHAGYPEVRCVAAAADGNIWLYDEVAFQLKKISPEGSTQFESPALNLLLPGRVSIRTIRDNGREVLAADPDQGILWFDLYAQYQRNLPWRNITTFALGDDYLVYYSDNALQLEQLEAFFSRQIPLPPYAQTHSTAARWLGHRQFLIQKEESLEIWRWD